MGKIDRFDINQKTTQATFAADRLNPDLVVARNNNINPGLPNPDDVTGCFRSPNAEPINLLDAPVVTTRTAELGSSVTNFTIAPNIGYRFDQPGGWWIEPVAGLRYSYSAFGNNAFLLGFDNGQVFRIQGGASIGSSSLVRAEGRKFLWTTVVGALLYSDVVIDGFVSSDDEFSPLAIKADQGLLRVQGVLRNEFDFLDGSIAYTEVLARGGEDYWGVGGKAGVRVEW
ncbi:MAG: autotransporter outer membrane beta-barrel domain-containing protein [Hyphomicrobium sp.]